VLLLEIASFIVPTHFLTQSAEAFGFISNSESLPIIIYSILAYFIMEYTISLEIYQRYGKNHLYEAINMVPDWWGIIIAKINVNGSVVFSPIREEENNKEQDNISVARLLWREEALRILEEIGEAKGFYSKSRDFIYEKIATVLDQKTLGNRVRETMFLRTDWRPDAPLILNGG